MSEVSYVIIPRSIEQHLLSNNRDLSAMFDVHKVSDILSQDDIGFYISVNMNANQHLSKPFKASFSQKPFNNINEEIQKEIIKWDVKEKKFKDVNTFIEYLGNSYEDKSFHGYEVVKIHDNILYLRLTGYSSEESYIESMDILFHKLVGIYPLEYVCSLPLFKEYELYVNKYSRKTAVAV